MRSPPASRPGGWARLPQGNVWNGRRRRSGGRSSGMPWHGSAIPRGRGANSTNWASSSPNSHAVHGARLSAVVLAAYYNERCEPPWSASELAHKLDDIYRDRYGADDWGKYVTEETGDDDEPTEGPPPDEEAAASPSGQYTPNPSPSPISPLGES